MRWKLFAPVAGLILVVTASASPKHLAAAGEPRAWTPNYWNVAGIKSDEKLEIYYTFRRNTPPPTDNIIWAFFTLQNATHSGPSEDPPCTETIKARVKPHPGIQTLQVELSARNEKVLINGEEVARLPLCFMEAKRVAVGWSYQILPFLEENQIPVVPNGGPLGFSNVATVGSSVVNRDGSTAASVAYPWRGTGYQYGDTDFLE
jgi:hypothetical protein